MAFNRYDKLQNLKTGKSEWTLRVRAQTLWKGFNRQTQEFRGLNVIFIDDSSCRIYAFVSAKILDLFIKDLKEGEIYTLSNFHVRVYAGDEACRAVRFDKHIYFANNTTLVCEKDNITKIPSFAFDLFELKDANKLITDNRYLIDVAGIIRDNNANLMYAKDDQNRCHIKFRITDGRSSLNVTFFNELAQDFAKALSETTGENSVVIIASAKVNQYEGMTCLNNYPATRFYLNVDHYSVKLLKARVPDPEPYYFPIEIPDDDKVLDIYTIADIKKLNTNFTKRRVRCHITVKKVEQNNNWYDNVCTACWNEVSIFEKRYYCATCKRNIPYPDKRFRLATVCNDSTGILAVIFPDDEIQRILGRNAFDVENDDNEVGDNIPFPPVLRFFEKKEYLLTLAVDESNLKKTSNIYMVIELNDPLESHGNHSPSQVATIPIQKDPCISVEYGTTHDPKHSPPTVKSTNKVRGRSLVDNVPVEMDENVPLSKCKVIKTEKATKTMI